MKRQFRRLKPAVTIVFLALLFLGAGCGGPSEAQKLATQPVTLKVWRVFDDSNTFSEIMNAYRAIHPNVTFEYTEKRVEEYEDELLRAFAEGTGPDIFSLHNTWIGEYKSLIKPLPESTKVAYSETRGQIKKETVYTLKEEPSLSMRALKSDFVEVAVKDVVREDKIVALPLSVDTLALYYNRDLLNVANIPEPPTTWTEFQEQVTKLSKIGQNNVVLQAGAAIGTSKNVERASDILNLLMMQNGVKMIDDRGVATFGYESGGSILAEDAVRFYTDFANPLKQVYTWNSKQPNSFDAFVNGKAAFFFGYSYHAPLIKAASPKLNFSISSVPQIEGGKTVNFANYWVETISKTTDFSDWAWNFIQFATKKDQVTSYIEKAKRPTALRALINTQIESETLSTFAAQTLTAKSWYKGSDAQATEQAFLDLIDAALSGSDLQKELIIAQNKVNQTF
ncbi:extracellular solute-binding protein [Candidatus Uhrbacteria bacterium]|nr:extracellular solute-binding protein [Candidatus Uhrbacteria bacterium]